MVEGAIPSQSSLDKKKGFCGLMSPLSKNNNGQETQIHLLLYCQ